MKKSFCEHLRELRGSASQSDFAQQIGTKQTTYSSWERGIKEPDLDTLCKISTHFGVSTDWLLGLPERGGSSTTVTGNVGAVAVGAGARASVHGYGGRGSTRPTDCANCKYKRLADAFKAL